MYNALARFAMNTGVRATKEKLVWRNKESFYSLSLLANGFETLAFFISLNCVKFASSRLTYT